MTKQLTSKTVRMPRTERAELERRNYSAMKLGLTRNELARIAKTLSPAATQYVASAVEELDAAIEILKGETT